MINMPALPPNDKNVSPLSLGLSAAHHNDSIGGGDSSVESSVVETNVFLASCFNDELKGGGGESDAEGEGYTLAKSFRKSVVLRRGIKLMAVMRLRMMKKALCVGSRVRLRVGFCLVLLKCGSTVSKSIVVSLKWDKYTFHAKFDGTCNMDEYSGYHEMPCGAQPVPLNDDGKRTFGGFDFSIKDGLPKMTSLDSVPPVQHVTSWCPMTGFLPLMLIS
jgi:hypothetical protein